MESIDQTSYRFCQPDGDDLKFFTGLLGNAGVLSDDQAKSAYGRDMTEDLFFPPAIVLKPDSAEQVSRILARCNERNIPVTAAGARTGLSGGSLPVHGGVALSLERMNRILHIDERNQQILVEPGLITQTLQEAVAEKGLYYAPDPASRGSCTIGGNLAENSGGPHAVKYGVTRDFVLNLEVVLADGSRFWTGANTLKNSTGYNLTHLLVGSEGTLGIITKAVLKLIPLPSRNVLMLAPFASSEVACEAVAAIFRKGITPSALEFMERDAIALAMKFTGDCSIPLPDDVEAHLLIELDGNDSDVLMNEASEVSEVLAGFGVHDVLFADSDAQKNALWNLRRKVGEAVKVESIYKEEDTVVPRFELPRLLKGVKEIGRKYQFRTVCYGHAGDGNLHVNILRGDIDLDVWNEKIPLAIREIFELTVGLGGTLSGEHGIGYVQKSYMDIAFNSLQMSIMKSIKSVFDPKGILNPGKIFP